MQTIEQLKKRNKELINAALWVINAQPQNEFRKELLRRFHLTQEEIYEASRPKKIYVSGKITGMDHAEASEMFERAQHWLSHKGWKVVNPMKLNHAHDHTWESYMKEDITHLLTCDAVFFLNNWQESRGAKIEKDIASAMGMFLFFDYVLPDVPSPDDF